MWHIQANVPDAYRFIPPIVETVVKNFSARGIFIILICNLIRYHKSIGPVDSTKVSLRRLTMLLVSIKRPQIFIDLGFSSQERDRNNIFSDLRYRGSGVFDTYLGNQ